MENFWRKGKGKEESAEIAESAESGFRKLPLKEQPARCNCCGKTGFTNEVMFELKFPIGKKIEVDHWQKNDPSDPTIKICPTCANSFEANQKDFLSGWLKNPLYSKDLKWVFKTQGRRM